MITTGDEGDSGLEYLDLSAGHVSSGHHAAAAGELAPGPLAGAASMIEEKLPYRFVRPVRLAISVWGEP